MATRKSQRVFIWVIAVVMTIGTIAGFVAMMIAPGNQKIDAAQQSKAYAEQQKVQEAAAAARVASSKPLDGYSSAAFDKASVTELKVDTLVQGNGTAAKADSTVSANYFGWTSDGKIFDSSNQDGKTLPVEFPLNGVIQGWAQGLIGVKAGSFVKLTIPASMAYAEAGSPPNIGPNEPLQFIVELKDVK